MKNRQNGFSSIEVLIAIAIISLISGTAAAAIYQTFEGTHRSNSHTTCIYQVQNAGYWISRDVLEAGTIAIDSNPATTLFMTLTIPVSGSDSKVVVYDLEDTAEGLKKLLRTDQDTGNQILIAEYLYYDPTGDPDNSTQVIEYVSPMLKLQITATSGDAMVTRKYEATQRVPSG